ncbi:LysM domain-containing protein [Geobacillus sp. BMUD]|uniref:LysM peptidoglycan-binding domain-containing protein n=1 Tax=Geobacillus TaxID=129337 RepID=UPI0004DF4929|nr:MULTISPECIES: LysM peptidoglycan-binding domain-containing protein [Geobacillus]NNU82995.1 LysM domain-containing protein [Geobacillus sp. BMUD]
MKKLILLLLLFLSSYIVYRDLAIGTLHPSSETAAADVQPNRAPIPYRTVTVHPGDTLLSIVEKELEGPLPVPLEQLIRDFERLNPGEQAQTLKIGKTYKVPIYR